MIPGPADGDSWEDWLRRRLLDRRRVVLAGPLDDTTAGRVSTELMFLDAEGDGTVDLQLDSEGGPLHAALGVVDTIELLGVPVRATCLGRAEGSAVAVYAAAGNRLATPHARFRLSEPSSSVTGTAGELAAWTSQRRAEAAAVASLLARATGQPLEHVEADLAAGRWLDAEEAVAYGLVHQILRPGSERAAERGERPFGFGPAR